MSLYKKQFINFHKKTTHTITLMCINLSLSRVNERNEHKIVSLPFFPLLFSFIKTINYMHNWVYQFLWFFYSYLLQRFLIQTRSLYDIILSYDAYIHTQSSKIFVCSQFPYLCSCCETMWKEITWICFIYNFDMN